MNEMQKRIAKTMQARDTEGEGWEIYVLDAVGVLKTLRHPTKAMSIAALKAVSPAAFLANPLNYNLLVWEAMIDEALRDE